MLDIRDLTAAIDDHVILDRLSLSVPAGQVHAIMGPNGSGKSTLAKVVAGHPAYTVTAGTISFLGQPLADIAPEDRARRGIFIGFQAPVEVPGVNNSDFLRLALNAKRTANGQAEMKAAEFAPLLAAKMAAVEMDVALKDRALNAGFSGGQKKRNEILQMLVLEPRLAVLDETDSGLDVDALHAVANGINAFRSPERAIVLITHHQRLLDLVRPDRVHVLAQGRIIHSAGPELSAWIDHNGYDELVAKHG